MNQYADQKSVSETGVLNWIVVKKLKNIIDKSKFKFKEIKSFYYFPSGRWDLKTKSGLLFVVLLILSVLFIKKRYSKS